ncbi:hypothetical protein INR49_007924, partial [Caranx melampygus]
MVRRAASVDTRLIRLLVLILTVLVQSARSSSQDAASYSCCPSPQIQYDPRCDHLWVINGQTIALSHGERKRYMPPCKEMKDDLMKLDQCVNLNVTITCNEQGLAKEQRIRYHGEPCPTSMSGSMAPGSQGESMCSSAAGCSDPGADQTLLFAHHRRMNAAVPCLAKSWDASDPDHAGDTHRTREAMRTAGTLHTVFGLSRVTRKTCREEMMMRHDFKYRERSDAYRFARWSGLAWGSWGPDQSAVVDGAALGALGPDGGGVLGDLGRHHTFTELQDLLVSQTWTLEMNKREKGSSTLVND